VTALFLLPAPAAAREPAPAAGGPLLDLGLLGKSLRQGLSGLGRLEIVEMLSAVAGGSGMGPGEGWFHPGQSRYGWDWLAARFDANKDGKIERPEFGGPAELFDRLDRDRDGVLTRADFDWSENSPWVRQHRLATSWFYLIDANSNGRVSRAEWQAFFEKASGGKGYVTVDDLRAALQPPRPKAPPGPGKGGPPPAVLVKGLLEGELGSLYEGPRLGQMAPDFTLPTPDGKGQVRLSQHRGKKPVVLIFGSFS
jgi:hypothetical protein